jgi:creatinine amidohydrolase
LLQTISKGVLLEDLTWVEAESALTAASVIVLPVGAAAKEHGPHLRLKSDWILADYLKVRVLEQCDVVIAPTLTYHYYPAFIDYPGSTSLRLKTARHVTIDVCRCLARHGPRRMYALNTGVSTIVALESAANSLASDGILLRYTNIPKLVGAVSAQVAEQEAGTHADEIETSMMLYIDPTSVDMTKAAKDYHPGHGYLRRDPGSKGVYSPSGIYGDATLANREKGRQVVEALVEGILLEIEDLRLARVPEKRAS